MSTGGSDTRDRVDSEQLDTHHAAIIRPTEAFEIIPDDPNDPDEWTLLEGDRSDNFGGGRWLTVDDPGMVKSLEEWI